MDWQLLSTHEHARRRFTAALLPIGTLEPHDGAPVGTDNLIPEALCARLAERLDLPRLPVMPYGLTNSLLAYPGACSLSAETLGGFLFDVGATLSRHGLRELFVINGHGGNTRVLREAAARLFRERDLRVAVIDWWHDVQADAAEVFGEGGFGHSAVDELGMLAGLRPDLGERIPRQRVPSFYNYKGLQAYPAVRPVITYDHPEDPVDLARLEPPQCQAFAERVTDLIERMIREVREGWAAIGDPEGGAR